MTEVPPDSVATQTAADGYEIQVAAWHVAGPVRGKVVVLHGVQSHFGWYGGLGRRLAAAGYEVRMPDRRGSGHNERNRGDTPNSRHLVADVAGALAALRGSGPATPAALVGISWGGKLAVVTAARHPELVDALALVCPGLTRRVGVTRFETLRIATAWLLRPRTTFPIPLGDPALFTASPEGQDYIAADPLGLRTATARLLAADTFLDLSVRRSLPRVRQPTLLMLAGRDRIIDNAKTRRLWKRVRASSKTVVDYPEAHHTLEFEPDPGRHAADLITWLDKTVGSPR